MSPLRLHPAAARASARAPSVHRARRVDRVRRALALLPSLSLAWALALPAGPARAEAEVPLAFDLTRAHAFTGIGAQTWLNPAHPGEAAALLRDMHAQVLRLSVLPKMDAAALGPGPLSLAQARERLEAATTAEQRGRVAALRQLAEQQHLRLHLVFWAMPEHWAEARDRKAGKKKVAHLANMDRVPDYVNLITAELMMLRQAGLTVEAVELTNEPQGAWDTKYEPDQYAELVLQARRRFDEQGLQAVRIDGPGTGLRNFAEFERGLRAKGALGALGFMTAHVYQSPEQLARDETPGVAGFLGQGRIAPIMITEFGVKKHNDEDAELAAADTDVDSPSYGLQTAAESLQLLGKGAQSVIYWQLEDLNFTKKKHGMLDAAGRRRPVAQAVQALFGGVAGQGRLVGAEGGPALLPATAVLADGRVWLLMANATGQAQSVNARVQGAGALRALGAHRAWAGGLSPEAALQGLSWRDGVLRATLAPGAVVSVELLP